MTWQETIGFFINCMPKPVGKTLLHQPEGSVREIRVRAGGKVRILTDQGEIRPARRRPRSSRLRRWPRRCASTPSMPAPRSSGRALLPCAGVTAWGFAGG